MIRAICFDLDGTLVQTELLKARSYAEAAKTLQPECCGTQGREVIEAYKAMLGGSRSEMAKYLLRQFGLEEAAAAKMRMYEVSTPWQAFVQERLRHYDKLLAEPNVLRNHLCMNNFRLLLWAREHGFLTALATMSRCAQANTVLRLLHFEEHFHFIATRDDVVLGKPNQEIYALVARELDVAPSGCLVIEDSATGVLSALRAGMGCIAVTSELTHEAVVDCGLLEPRWIVENPSKLQATVERYVAELGEADAGLELVQRSYPLESA
ncbi:HAD family hydrolase [Desulfonatronum thioautotrophicum]|uniref:HAD family hydrolase n=1 Tax=Desulfonatronum thioautotrophicum TaxID=617001 RepID=UPI0005EBB859|nr:HAD family phosphatase [Desulfonatronum thioautotrophicum]